MTKAATNDSPRTVYSKRARLTTGAHASVAIAPTAESTSATTTSRTAPAKWTAGTVAITANTAVSTAVPTAAPLRSESSSTSTNTTPNTRVNAEKRSGRPPVRAASPQVYAVLVAIAPTSTTQVPTWPTRPRTSTAVAASTTSSQRAVPSRCARPGSAGGRTFAGGACSARREGERAARLPPRERGSALDTFDEA